MNWFWIVAIVIAASVIGGWLTKTLNAGSKPNAFASLGDISGKTLDEIAAVVGSPNHSEVMPDGGFLYQWMQIHSSGGYHYAIAFDAEGKAIGYTHQSVTGPV